MERFTVHFNPEILISKLLIFINSKNLRTIRKFNQLLLIQPTTNAKCEKKIKEESPYLASPVGGEGWFELLDGDGLLDVESQKIRLMFDGLKVNFWRLFELYLVRLVP